jgi:hypothetical protein
MESDYCGKTSRTSLTAIRPPVPGAKWRGIARLQTAAMSPPRRRHRAELHLNASDIKAIGSRAYGLRVGDA